MSSDAFIITTACDANPATAIRQAVELGGVSLSRVQDAIFGLDGAAAPDTGAIIRAAGLHCPSVAVSSSMRALFFAAESLLSGDADLIVVIGLQHDVNTAYLLASPDAVGRLNILPRARFAARLLTGPASPDRIPLWTETGDDSTIPSTDIDISASGDYAAGLLKELLEDLEAQSARWGMLTVDESVMLIERL